MSASPFFSKATLKNVLVGGVLEFSPILLFISSFPYLHIYKATMVLMVATIISTIATYRIQKRLPYVGLYVTLLTILFGYLTLLHQQPRFIQMRDTLYDLTFALTLMIGLITNIHFLKTAFHQVVPMTDRAWNKLTYAWIVFFLACALMNEFVRRNYSLHDWFEYKSFIVLLTIAFGLASLYLFYEKEKKSE